jgi:hypothetical protein
MVNKLNPRPNVAFKCNYCDGGRSPKQVGFNGVCSDEVLKYNIKVLKRPWCRDNDCSCKLYLDGKLTRKELDAQCKKGGSVCYESQILRDWRTWAGGTLTGENSGAPKKMYQAEPNSLGILTTRHPDANSEEDRLIFAVFLIDETYEGNDDEAGWVTAQKKFRIMLSPEEATKMLFWKYHANGNNSSAAAWGTGLFRYIDNQEAAQILRDISTVKNGSNDQNTALKFYNHFCTINGIDIGKLPEPNGALKRTL